MTPSEALSLAQGSPEWLELRAGMITASRAYDAFNTLTSGKNKGCYTAEHDKYKAELIVERLTHQPYPHFVTREMEWGREQEPFARAAYELERGVMVDQVGFVIHPTLANFGCSPDGWVGDEGMIQIKCPATLTHLTWLKAGTVPLEYWFQILAELSCNPTRQWSDFVSFDPRLPKHLQLFICRCARAPHEKIIASLEAQVAEFNEEIERDLQSLPQPRTEIAEVLDWPKDDEVEL